MDKKCWKMTLKLNSTAVFFPRNILVTRDNPTSSLFTVSSGKLKNQSLHLSLTVNFK